MEKKYQVVLLGDKLIQIETVGKTNTLYNPEDLMRVMEYVKIIR